MFEEGLSFYEILIFILKLFVYSVEKNWDWDLPENAMKIKMTKRDI
jgi:hypothetical protein